MKLCIACNENLPKKAFYVARPLRDGERKEYYSATCKKCHTVDMSRRSISRARAMKARLVAELGGKCTKCGGVFHPAVYDFHHRDPKEKLFCVCTILSGAYSVISAEAKKCDLLCANCHRELEAQYAA